MSAEIDWDTYEPTRAVRAASMTLFTADAVEAMCFGWVPQAREALSVALDVEEMARAFVAPTPWGDLSDAVKSEYLLRMRHVRDAITGGAS